MFLSSLQWKTDPTHRGGPAYSLFPFSFQNISDPILRGERYYLSKLEFRIPIFFRWKDLLLFLFDLRKVPDQSLRGEGDYLLLLLNSWNSPRLVFQGWLRPLNYCLNRLQSEHHLRTWWLTKGHPFVSMLVLVFSCFLQTIALHVLMLLWFFWFLRFLSGLSRARVLSLPWVGHAGLSFLFFRPKWPPWSSCEMHVKCS